MNINEIYKECHRIVDDPVNYLAEEKEKTGQKYIGYVCIFPPEELLHASGYIPVRIMGFSKRFINSEKYITSNCCEFAKSIIDFISSDDANILEGFVFGHCCDTLQVTADITRNMADKKVLVYNVPTNLDSSYAYEFMKKETEVFKSKLEQQFNVRINEDALQESYNIYQINRQLLKQLYKLRIEKPGIISGYDSLAVIIAGLYMPKEKHNELLKVLLELLEKEKETFEETDKKKILVSGLINCNLNLIKIIEESDAIIVTDDLCEGARTIPLVECGDFKYPDTLAKVTANLFCPVKNYKKISYEQLLRDKLKEAVCEGIIFVFFTFCDPQFMEYAYVKKKFSEEKIKTLLVETVINTNNIAQLQTRIEAYIESL